MPSLFGNMSPEDYGRYTELIDSMDGTEPCSLEPDLFVEDYTRGIKEQEAQALCADCPLLELCREYAVEAKEPYHVWGGTTPRSRGIPRGYRPWADQER